MKTAHLSIPFGITIGLLASFVQSLGLTIQRKSHVINNALPEEGRKREWKRPLWLLGFAIFLSSNILGSLVQIASLPVVILAPLGAVSLLWNAFFARLLLGDVFSPWMILGTIFIAAGAVLIAVFGIVPEPTRSLEDLLELFRRRGFVVYFSILGLVVVVSLAATHIMEFSYNRRLAAELSEMPDTPPILLSPPVNHPSGLTTGPTEQALTERTPLLDPKSKTLHSKTSSSQTFPFPAHPSPAIERTRITLAISYSSFSGILSGMCLLFAKSGVELLLLTLQGDNQFWRWQSWMLVLGLVVFALLQLWYMHKALILADPTLVCPSAFCFYNLSSIVNGLVYFNQFSLIPPLHLSLVVLGIVVLLIGVWVVSIQAGGGGVDVGTWQEVDEEEELMGEEGSLFGEEGMPFTMSGSPPPTSPASTARHPRLSSISIPTSPSDSRSLTSSPTHDRQMTDSALVSPSLLARRRSTRRRDTLAGSIHLGEGLGDTLGLPGGGFQIGLSPVSPGFSILPKDRTRRRRVSGLAESVSSPNGSNRRMSGYMDSPQSPNGGGYPVAGTGLGIGRPSAIAGRGRSGGDTGRRVVSEGDVLIRASGSGLDDGGVSSDEEDVPVETSGEEVAQGAKKRRWGWFGRVLKR